MKFIILYSNKSSKTGRLLLRKFATISNKALRKRTNKRFRADLVLRWGSTEAFPRLTSSIELNSLQSVKNTSEKLTMMRMLVVAEIPTPKVCLSPSNMSEIELDSFRNEDGLFYVRGSNQEVRYDNEVKLGDLYITQPLHNKRREYRVHVFDGKILEMYEKVAREDNVSLFKAYNCDFKRVNPENCRVSLDDQNMCIKAVNALGLTFGAVDLMRDKDQNCFISEVNSSPALNSLNIERYFNKIMEYYTNNMV